MILESNLMILEQCLSEVWLHPRSYILIFYQLPPCLAIQSKYNPTISLHKGISNKVIHLPHFCITMAPSSSIFHHAGSSPLYPCHHIPTTNNHRELTLLLVMEQMSYSSPPPCNQVHSMQPTPCPHVHDGGQGVGCLLHCDWVYILLLLLNLSHKFLDIIMYTCVAKKLGISPINMFLDMPLACVPSDLGVT